MTPPERLLEHTFEQFKEGWLTVDDVCFILRDSYGSAEVRDLMKYRKLISE